MDETFWGVERTAEKQSRRKADMVAWGDKTGQSALEADPGIYLNQKKTRISLNQKKLESH